MALDQYFPAWGHTGSVQRTCDGSKKLYEGGFVLETLFWKGTKGNRRSRIQ